MSARKSAPAKHHRGGDGQDAAVRQGERNPTRLHAQVHKKERKSPQKSAGAVTAGRHGFPAQHLNQPNPEANLKRVAIDEATGVQGSGKVDLAVNTAFQVRVGNLDTGHGPFNRTPVRLYLRGLRRRAAQATQRQDQGKCDRAGAGLDAAQSQQPSGQHGKEIYCRHAHRGRRPAGEIAPAFLLMAALRGSRRITADMLPILGGCYGG